MAVYQTFVGAMNEKIRRQIAVHNPFQFRHVSNLKGIDHFEDIGPCVILASPGECPGDCYTKGNWKGAQN